MTTAERIRRIREVERAAAKLTRQGWRVERVQHTDSEGEPFRTTIDLAIDGVSAMDGAL